MTTTGIDAGAVARATERVRELATAYEPPRFEHVPDPDAALFLCAIDHRTGYRGRYLVGGQGPLEGSALMWAVGIRASERRRGLLTAAALWEITAERIAELFRIGERPSPSPSAGPPCGVILRSAWSATMAVGPTRSSAPRPRLGGAAGLLALLAPYAAYADPLRKKSFLFAKICARRGWFEAAIPRAGRSVSTTC